jgi:cytochrome o ubiquinol oxidase subunit 2
MKLPKPPRWSRLMPCGALLLAGCNNLSVLDPKGRIGATEKSLILTATWLMLLVVIPVIVMTLAFAWKYRASNKEARYEPEWSHSTAIEVVVWLIPCLIIVALGYITWKSTHELDPYKPIESNIKPVEIEVVSLNWKWLFIYPELHIATVNQIAFPVNTPVNFKITSDAVMNSFFIPQLGSQVYAMAGMQTKLHLIANEAGRYDGISANYSGGGFSGMRFEAKAMSGTEFDEWVKTVRASSQQLTQAGYDKLAAPSEKDPVAYFASVEPQLFSHILNKYMGMPGEMNHDGHGAHEMTMSANPMAPVCTARAEAAVPVSAPAQPLASRTAVSNS